MKVGIFTNAYHPIISGVVNAIDCIDHGLTALGHRVYVIAPRYGKHRDSSASVISFPSISLTSRADFPLPIPYIPQRIREVKNLRLDIVHAQHPFLLGVLGAKLAKEQNIPMVFTFHTLYEQYVHYAPPILPRFVLRFAVRKMVGSFVRKSDAVVVPSPSILDLVRSYGGAGRTHLIPNGIDLAPFQKADPAPVRQKLHLQSRRVLIFVGRLAEEKNLSFLIRAFSKVKAEVPAALLLLVGDGPHRKALEALANELGLEKDVVFTGLVPYPEVPHVVKCADLFVTCSTTEVKPLSLLEAMACGVSVLAVNASGAVDTIVDEHDGVLTPESEDEFAAAAVALLRDERKLKTLGENAKKTAEGFGSLEMAKRLETLYTSLRAAR